MSISKRRLQLKALLRQTESSVPFRQARLIFT